MMFKRLQSFFPELEKIVNESRLKNGNKKVMDYIYYQDFKDKSF